MIMPNFLIIGAPKAGTTSLYSYLKQHPEIYMSSDKEPAFFAFEGTNPQHRGPGDELIWRERRSRLTLERYQQLFKDVGDRKAIGEASTAYIYVGESAARIKHYVPDMKIIAILRQPVERGFSSYVHLLRDGREWLTDFERAWQEEGNRIKNNYSWAWHYQQVGYYWQHLQKYFQLFDRSQIKIYLYEDWKDKPIETIRDLLTFLEVDPNYTPDMSVKHNTSPVVYKYPQLYKLLREKNKIKDRIRNLIPAPMRRLVRATILKKIENSKSKPPELSQELRTKLTQVYREDIFKLQESIGRDLSHWLK